MWRSTIIKKWHYSPVNFLNLIFVIFLYADKLKRQINIEHLDYMDNEVRHSMVSDEFKC